MSWRRDREHYRDLKAQGRCVNCAVKLPPGTMTVRCGSCMEKRNRQRRMQRMQWHAAGLCRTCGAETREGYSRCDRCLEAQRRQYRNKAGGKTDA